MQVVIAISICSVALERAARVLQSSPESEPPLSDSFYPDVLIGVTPASSAPAAATWTTRLVRME